jgi:lipid II:glycine glycyltransferase (peptidoglycan interpeptide bridge formation enzyme)
MPDTENSVGSVVPPPRTGSGTDRMDATNGASTHWPGADRNTADRPNTPTRPTPVTVRWESAPDAATLAAWNAVVLRTAGTDVTQLSAWAAIRSLAGYSPRYVFAFQGGALVGGALILRRRLAGFLSIGYLPYGPVIDESVVSRSAVVTALVDELVGFARAQRLMFVQPPERAQDVSDALLARGFRPSKAGIAPAGSYRLDLTPPLEQIRAGFSKRLKSWTNRWAAKGVRVRQGDESDLALLVSLMTRTGARQGFRPPPLDYVRTMYRELGALGQVAIFVGEVDGVAVSADVVTVCAGMVRGRLGGFDGSGEAGKLSVPAAVRWEIIQWAKASGYRYLDFGGLPERMLVDMIDHGVHSSDGWPSAQRSKLQFNGHAFRYPTPVELVRPSLVRRAYDWGTSHAGGRRIVAAAKDILRGNRRHTHDRD